MDVRRAVRRLLGRARGRQRVPRCLSLDVRSEHEVRSAALQLAGPGEVEAAALEALIRELVALNTPGLFLHIVQRGGPLRVVLKPWSGRTIRFRGRNYFVEAGAAAGEGIEAFTRTPGARVTALYPTSPDHPVNVVSLEHQGTLIHTGEFPPYLTHLTLVMNGVVSARCERLLHERGTQVFWSGLVA